MRALDVRLKLNQIRCIDEGHGIGAEPHLWTLFFKLDGDSARLSPALTLSGTATVRGAPADRGRLPEVDPGEAIAIPSAIGEFNTLLRPIPLETPLGDIREVGGVVGCVTILMEGDSAHGSAIAQGHAALDEAVRDCLDRLVPSLGFAHPQPTEAELEAMRSKIAGALTRAVRESLLAWGWLEGFGNVDDRIGSGVFCYDHRQLERAVGTLGLEIYRRWRSKGDWELRGRATASLA
jgi:hypothetical protein